jgi:hypothetical protein
MNNNDYILGYKINEKLSYAPLYYLYYILNILNHENILQDIFFSKINSPRTFYTRDDIYDYNLRMSGNG